MSSELGVERPTTLALSETPVGERHVHFSDVNCPRLVTTTRHSTSLTPSPRKPRPDPDFRPKRKRSMSFSSPGEHRFISKWRYKRARVLPSKFLLGGSITDPLNLGSLDKEEILQTPEETSATTNIGGGVSRRSSAVRVIIPPNINDPLNLDASSDNEELHTDALQRQLRKRRRRKRKRRLSEPVEGSGGFDAAGGECARLEAIQAEAAATLLNQTSKNNLEPLTVNTDLVSPPVITETHRDINLNQPVTSGTPGGSKPSCSNNTVQRTPFKKQRHKSDNKIVSPVIPQPGGDRKRHPSHSRHNADQPHLSQQNLQPPKSFNPKNEVFQYGNYNKYYGYRNPDQTPDVRLDHLKREWFEGRDVLDIGCNIGHVALTVAREFNPNRVVGIDIDKKLVNIAQKNIKHYMRKGHAEEANFPKSMRLLYGPLRPPVQADGHRTFPHNIKFVHGNYVLESDELLEMVRPEYDVVLCLSITKWIHLNWGDAGLKRFFRRIFYNLRPGGRLVLEPQAWPSYNKRRKLTKRIFDNYKSIRLFPEKFNDFLLHEVGFSTSEKLVTPNHVSRGFQRPIIIYTKANNSNKSSPLGDSATTTNATTVTSTNIVSNTSSTTKRGIDCDYEASQHSGDALSTNLEVKNVVERDWKRDSKRRKVMHQSSPDSTDFMQEHDNEQKQHKGSHSISHIVHQQIRIPNSCDMQVKQEDDSCTGTGRFTVNVVTEASTSPSSTSSFTNSRSFSTCGIHTTVSTTTTTTTTTTIATATDTITSIDTTTNTLTTSTNDCNTTTTADCITAATTDTNTTDTTTDTTNTTTDTTNTTTDTTNIITNTTDTATTAISTTITITNTHIIDSTNATATTNTVVTYPTDTTKPTSSTTDNTSTTPTTDNINTSTTDNNTSTTPTTDNINTSTTDNNTSTTPTTDSINTSTTPTTDSTNTPNTSILSSSLSASIPSDSTEGLSTSLSHTQEKNASFICTNSPTCTTFKNNNCDKALSQKVNKDIGREEENR